MTENDLIFRLLLGILMISFVSHRAYYTRKYKIDDQDISSHTPSTLKIKVAGAFAVFGFMGSLLYIVYPSWMTWSSIMLPLWARWCGVVIVFLGFGLLQWAQRTIGDNWSDEPHISSEHQLVEVGPYRWIRHPIYTSFLLILGSTLLIATNWFIGGMWIGMVLIDISYRIPIEEDLLITAYGDKYRSYMVKTGRIFPRIPMRN